jgi:hypothetical protein
MGEELDIEEVIREARKEHASEAKRVRWAPRARRDLLDIWRYFAR